MEIRAIFRLDTASDLFDLIYADEYKFLTVPKYILRCLGPEAEMDASVIAWERSVRIAANELGDFVPHS